MFQLLVPLVAFASHGAPSGRLRHWGKRLHRIPHCGDPSCFKWCDFVALMTQRVISSLFRDSPDKGYPYESMKSKEVYYSHSLIVMLF